MALLTNTEKGCHKAPSRLSWESPTSGLKGSRSGTHSQENWTQRNCSVRAATAGPRAWSLERRVSPSLSLSLSLFLSFSPSVSACLSSSLCLCFSPSPSPSQSLSVSGSLLHTFLPRVGGSLPDPINSGYLSGCCPPPSRPRDSVHPWILSPSPSPFPSLSPLALRSVCSWLSHLAVQTSNSLTISVCVSLHTLLSVSPTLDVSGL